MQSKSTRLAYLRRLLKRLEGEEARLNNLVAAGELTEEGAYLGAEQLKRNRAELLSELRTLGEFSEQATDSPSSAAEAE